MNRRSEPTCPCGTPIDGATLCTSCTKTLAWALANIAAYHTDLDTLRTRQTRYTDPAPLRRGGGPLPLPVDLRFTDPQGHNHTTGETWGTGTDLDWVTTNTLTTWVRHLLEQHPHLPGPRTPTVTGCCTWLLRHTDRIRVNEAGPDLLDELLDLEKQLRRMIDRPPDRICLGQCTAGLSGLAGTWICGAELHAPPGATEVTCTQCNTTYRIADRRTWLLNAAEDEWATATDIARGVTVLSDYDRGERRLVDRIGKWVTRGRLQIRGTTPSGDRLYRVGDVLDLLTDDTRDTEERSA